MPPVLGLIGLAITEIAAPTTALATAGTIAGAAGTALGVGEAIDSAVNSGGGGGGGASPSTSTPLNYMSPSDIQSVLSAIGVKIPDIVASTGGGLSPTAAGNVAGVETGNAGDIGLIQQAVNSFLGGGAAPAPGGSAAPGSAPAGNFNIAKFMRGINPNAPGFTLQPPF